MAKYVPKAQEVEADQFTVASVSSKKDGIEFIDKAKLDKAGLERRTAHRDGRAVLGFSFPGKNGPEFVSDGDYIVTSRDGRYSVSKDDFEALYKPAGRVRESD